MLGADSLLRKSLGAFVLLFVLVPLLSGCGFKLRGAVEFPPQVTDVYIQAADRYTPFFRELSTAIRDNGLQLAKSPDNAQAVVRVQADETGRRALTVSVRNVPREYEIFYLVRCEIDIDGQVFVPSQEFILTRDYTFDETQVLGKALEEDVLREALARDIVGLLAQTISAAQPAL